MLILSFGCLRFLRESCLLYAFLLGYLPSIFLTFSAKPIDFYLQDCLSVKRLIASSISCSVFAFRSFTAFCPKFILATLLSVSLSSRALVFLSIHTLLSPVQTLLVFFLNWLYPVFLHSELQYPCTAPRYYTYLPVLLSRFPSHIVSCTHWVLANIFSMNDWLKITEM